MITKVKRQKAKGKIFQFRPANSLRFLYFAFCLFTFAFLLSAPVSAQDEPPKDAAPPPMKFIPKDERKRIEGEKDIKKRTQLSLDLLEIHLTKAEQLTEQNEFQKGLTELSNFHAILENVLNYLNSRNDGSDKVDNNFKRLEIGIRKTIPRLEVVRRGMPFSYGYYVQRIQRFVREARSKALDPLFSDSVIRQKQ